MARSSKLKREIAEACRSLPYTNSNAIVLRTIRMDQKIAAYIDRSTRGPMWDVVEVHHIFGRPKSERYTFKNHSTNLIRLNRGVHQLDYQFPKQLELACLHAQWTLQVVYDAQLSKGLAERLDLASTFWNVEVLNQICGASSLVNRIEVFILPIVRGTGLEEVAHNLISEIENADIDF